MPQNLLDQFETISAKIEAERFGAVDFSVLFGLGEQAPYDPEADKLRAERHFTAMLALHTLRLHICLVLAERGYRDCAKQIQPEFAEVVETIKAIEHDWTMTDELYCDAMDLILLLAPQNRDNLLRRLNFQTRRKIKVLAPMRYFVFYLAEEMAHYYQENGFMEESLTIHSNLIYLSEARNSAFPDMHREAVARVLDVLVDLDQKRTAEIGDAQLKYFRGTSDFSTSRFYWYYAFALDAVERSAEAAPLFALCHKLCLEVEGERSWIGARAKQMTCLHLLDSNSPDDVNTAEAYLWDFLKRIDEHDFSDADGLQSEIVGGMTRYALLVHHMDTQSLKPFLSELLRFRKFCEAYEDNPQQPRLKIRVAENLLCGYYLEVGDYLQAAQAARNALKAVPPEGVLQIPSDTLLYSNMLLCFSAMNDTEQMVDLAQLLAEKLNQEDLQSADYYRLTYLLETVERKLGLSMDDRIDTYKRQLIQLSARLQSGNTTELDESGVAFALLVMEMISTIWDTFDGTYQILDCCQSILTYLLDHPRIYSFSDSQSAIAWMELAWTAWMRHNPEALAYIDRSMAHAESLPAFGEGRISLTSLAAAIYCDMGSQDKAIQLAQKTLTGVTAAWQKATSYLNDHRICQMLSFVQRSFNNCYAILRTLQSDEVLYEQLLCFKNLPELVGCERNRLLRLAPVDEHLKRQIFQLQDRLADAQWSDAIQGTQMSAKMTQQLQELEADFATKFPQNMSFTKISYTSVVQALPEDAVLVEYYFVPGKSALSGRPYTKEDWELDVFVVHKHMGEARLHRIKLPRADVILEKASRFIEILQRNEIGSGNREPLRAELYRKLIMPVFPWIEGAKMLYIAPDADLCNLPFEILYADGSVPLGNNFKVCRLICGRDLLSNIGGMHGHGTPFVLGDPDYEAGKESLCSDMNCNAPKDFIPVKPLPFSGLEAKRVSLRCHTRPYTRAAATKYALQRALPCKIIHLATHGNFDVSMETDSLYSARLLFAGYNYCWLPCNMQDAEFGNSILTADEISRMDLHETELVVLSACKSGMSDPSYDSVQGLLSAFSAAGVHWIVSHIWQANDFSTPILMDAFYDAYLYRGMDVPDALRYAKAYLRGATIGELRQNGWLTLQQDSRISQAVANVLTALARAADHRKPFTDEAFWGGFICHQCR